MSIRINNSSIEVLVGQDSAIPTSTVNTVSVEVLTKLPSDKPTTKITNAATEALVFYEMPAPTKVCIGGAWRSAFTYHVKIGDGWHRILKIYTLDAGAWLG